MDYAPRSVATGATLETYHLNLFETSTFTQTHPGFPLRGLSEWLPRALPCEEDGSAGLEGVRSTSTIPVSRSAGLRRVTLNETKTCVPLAGASVENVSGDHRDGDIGVAKERGPIYPRVR